MTLKQLENQVIRNSKYVGKRRGKRREGVNER